MIDTHAHLDGEEFKDDLDEVVNRAKNAGIQQVFIPNISANGMPHLLDTCRKYNDYFCPMLGIHPEEIHESAEENENDLRIIEEKLEQCKERKFRTDNNPASPKVIAIGEVGLDYYWDDHLKERQKEVFTRQVEWANRYELPLMIHARSAHEDLMEILDQHLTDGATGIFHCFSGTAEEACQLLHRFPKFALGIGGILTFKKSKLPEILQEAHVSLQQIVLETDSPYMAPVPHRGKRNESAFVVEVASRLAEIYDLSIDEIDKITTQNCKRIFKNGPWT